jgi:hypothetical protein
MAFMPSGGRNSLELHHDYGKLQKVLAGHRVVPEWFMWGRTVLT